MFWETIEFRYGILSGDNIEVLLNCIEEGNIVVSFLFVPLPVVLYILFLLFQNTSYSIYLINMKKFYSIQFAKWWY